MPPGERAEEPGYLLQILPHVDERTDRPATLVILHTTRSFASPRYELAVDARMDSATLRLKILGLQAPHLDLPGPGPAEFRKDLEEWTGDYRVIVEGPDVSRSTVSVRASSRGVHLTEPVTVGIVSYAISGTPC